MKTVFQSYEYAFPEIQALGKASVIFYPFGKDYFIKAPEVSEFCAMALANIQKEPSHNYIGFTKNSNQNFHHIFCNCIENGKFYFETLIEVLVEVQAKMILDFHIFLEHFEEFIDCEYLEQFLLDCEEIQYMNLTIHFKTLKKGEKNND